ncbi:acyltransferase [Jiangella rhizosphaerae]|uniref:Acyltransferase n=1 Tax=Jiangella rhizosphaerae TaxID=2293569 RepID=A0A418KV23_9ACTN|nr:acyltransferase [Jiangella rhizosphaerae]RIQ33686.1 acyltransferase [Jiangella rhizosphaerae]
MSVWSWLDRGASQPSRTTPASRLVARAGLARARRHDGVTAPASCLLHPEARIHPRDGRIVLGERCLIAPGAVVQGDVTFGDDCSAQAYAVIVGYPGGRVTLGSGVRVAPHAMLIGANHVFAGRDRPIHAQGLEAAPITVGDDVWIAGRVTIVAGVTVGSGSVLAAGAVVTRDVPPFSVVAGVPARVIKTR